MIHRRFRNEYFLAQIWEQGSNVHRDLWSGNRVRELARSGDGIQSATIFASASNGLH
jgi:hypothetical protein